MASGKFSAETTAYVRDFRTGQALNALAGDGGANKEIRLLLDRLAKRGLLEYRLARSRTGGDGVIIEPQTPDYRPHVAPLRATDVLVLSRFAYLRRRADEMVLELPRAGALFRICDPAIAGALAALAVPRQIKWLQRQTGFPPIELLALLVDCQIFSRSMLLAAIVSARPRAMTISFFGTSTIFYFTPAAPRAAMPTRSADFIVCGCHAAAAGGAVALAWRENWSGQIRGARTGASARRKTAAGTSFCPRLRQPATGHARRNRTIS